MDRDLELEQLRLQVKELLRPRKLTIYTQGGRIAYQALLNPQMPEMLWNADFPLECWGFRVEQI